MLCISFGFDVQQFRPRLRDGTTDLACTTQVARAHELKTLSSSILRCHVARTFLAPVARCNCLSMY